MSTETFVEKCLNGDVLLDEVDEYVETWHTADTDQSLPEFLGMTEEEYNAWVLDESVLPYILKARKYHQSLERVLEHDVERVAARNGSQADVLQLLKWLHEHGR